MRYYAVMHALGVHSWDLPALAVAAMLVVMILVHRHNQKKRGKDFEEELEEKINEIRENLEDGLAKEVAEHLEAQ